MDITDDVKEEILLLTRYLLDFFRGLGLIKAADKFAKEANIDEQNRLGKALTITTSNQLPLSVDQSSCGQLYTSTPRMHLSPQQGGQDNGHAMHSKLDTSDSGMISGPKMTLFFMLKGYIVNYFKRNGNKISNGCIVIDSDINEEQPCVHQEVQVLNVNQLHQE
ncbi:hypothetical protein Lser_V15G04389 [Lactuca serriola]